MKTFVSSVQLWCLIIVATSLGCKKSELSFSAAPFKHANYGELPLLPKKQIVAPGKFYPIADSTGSLQPAKTRRETILAVGDQRTGDKSCKIKQGTEVSIVGIVKTSDNKELAIAQIEIPCLPKGASISDPKVPKIFEGYIALEDIEFKNKTLNNRDIASLNQRDFDGPTSTPIAGSNKTPKQIIADGKIAEIKDLIKRDTMTPVGQDIASSISGCLAVEQGRANGALFNSGLMGCDSKNMAALGAGYAALLMNCSFKGNDFRSGQTKFNLAVFGKASAWKITPYRGYAPADPNSNVPNIIPTYIGSSKNNSSEPKNSSNSMPSKTFSANQYEINKNGLTMIPVDQVIGANDWMATRGYFVVQGLNNSGVNVGSPCIHAFSIASPIVLDLSKSQREVRTIDTIGNKVSFDLDANGIKENSGWVYPYMGFLALDINNNGRIDNGSELFGEYSTNQHHQKFKNGYQALAMYDLDRNGKIDARDPIFKKLLVWTDTNMDGISQKEELRSLTYHEISALDVMATTVEPKKTDLNKVLYSSRYYGPKHCGTKGCATYDIFFHTETSEILSAQK